MVSLRSILFERNNMAKPVEVIEEYQPESSDESNCMERWNELIAGFVLGNLTPEEAESVAQILTENPQLASHIARLRNTATVRALGQTEWSTARSQDGSEGWADTALDRPLYEQDVYGQSDRPFSELEPTLANSKIAGDRPVGLFALKEPPIGEQTGGSQIQPTSDRSLLASAAASIHPRFVQKSASRKAVRLPCPAFERFSLIEAMLVPVFNPLWWMVIGATVLIGVDSFRVRRSHQSTLEELTELRASPQLAPSQPIDRP